MAKKSALNLLISKTCVALVNGMSGWKQTSRTRLANFLASVTWYVLARRRKIALTNLRLCFPEWSEQKRVETAKGVFRNLIRAALDHSVLAKGTEAQVLEMVKFEGKEQFEELCKTDKVIIVAPHFVGLDAGGIAMNTIVRGASLYQTQSNPVWDKWAFDARKRFSDPVLIPKSNSAMKEVIRALRASLPFYYLPDMDHGARNSGFVPFFLKATSCTYPNPWRTFRQATPQPTRCASTKNLNNLFSSIPINTFGHTAALRPVRKENLRFIK